MSEQNPDPDEILPDDFSPDNGVDSALRNGEVASADRATADGPDLSTREDWRRMLDEQRDKYLRLAAEYENFRKRTARERQEAESRGQATMVAALIEALDDIARFAHVDPSTTDAATIVQGVDMVERKIFKALGALGLEVVNPVDHAFDPAIHEAVATEPALSAEDDHVVAKVFQPGYLFNGQLLRPARVVVKLWPG